MAKTKKTTKRKKPQKINFKYGPVSKNKGSYYLRYRTKKGEKLKRTYFKTKKDALLFERSLKLANKSGSRRTTAKDIKVVKKTKRPLQEIRSVSEKLYSPTIGEFLSAKGGAYRYRLTTIEGEKIVTRSKKLFEILLNDEVQKQKDIVNEIKKKYKLTGTYGRIYPDTLRNETKEGRITSFNVDFSKYPNLDIFRKYYDEFKTEYTI